jgi:hypothetical protein
VTWLDDQFAEPRTILPVRGSAVRLCYAGGLSQPDTLVNWPFPA